MRKHFLLKQVSPHFLLFKELLEQKKWLKQKHFTQL